MARSSSRWRILVLLAVAGGSLGAMGAVRPIRQDPAYHAFADQRTLAGLAHALNVLSNLPFLVVGAWGLWTLYGPRPARFERPWERGPWTVFMASVFLTAFGSAWYHHAPSDATLFWDRLPMTLGFSSLLGVMIVERVDERWGGRLFVPLVAAGVASLIYGHPNDLRFYLLLQAWAVVLTALMLALFPSRYTGTHEIVAVLVLYGLAKVLETLDAPIYRTLGFVSGHSLKHLAAGFGAWRLVVMLRDRGPAPKMGDAPGTAAA